MNKLFYIVPLVMLLAGCTTKHQEYKIRREAFEEVRAAIHAEVDDSMQHHASRIEILTLLRMELLVDGLKLNDTIKDSED